MKYLATQFHKTTAASISWFSNEHSSMFIVIMRIMSECDGALFKLIIICACYNNGK